MAVILPSCDCHRTSLMIDLSTLAQVMAWCRQATSHYLSQCWPRSISPYGVSAWNGRPWPGRSQNWMLMYFIINLSGSQQFSGSSIQNQVELSEWATGRFMHCGVTRPQWVNSLAPGRCGNNSKCIIFTEVNIGSGDGLVPSGNKPLPESLVIQICVAVWHH